MSAEQKEERPRDFESLIRELTQGMERLERGNLPLEESIRLYGECTELYQAARKILDEAQARLEVLVAGADGLSTRALDAEEFLKDR